MTDRDADLDALEAKAQKATMVSDSPWTSDGSVHDDCGPVAILNKNIRGKRADELSAYIAACSPDAILALIRRVREADKREQAVVEAWGASDKSWRARAEAAEAAAAGMRAALSEAIVAFHEKCHPGEPARKAMVSERTIERWRAALADPTGARVAAVVSAAEAAVVGWRKQNESWQEAEASAAANNELVAAVDALHAERGTT